MPDRVIMAFEAARRKAENAEAELARLNKPGVGTKEEKAAARRNVKAAKAELKVADEALEAKKNWLLRGEAAPTKEVKKGKTKKGGRGKKGTRRTRRSRRV